MVAGRAVELDAHLARLRASARELYGDAAEARTRGPVRALAEAQARDRELGRLRLTLAPDGAGGLALSASAADVDPALPFPPRERGPALAAVEVPGGLGPHKWADRRLLEAAAARLDGALPLIVDADGAVLEAERANVFAVTDAGTLLTPPLDGRILPGVARARAIEAARALGIAVEESALSLATLRGAADAFLTGSVRGVEPLRALAGVDFRPRVEVGRALAAELARRWLGPTGPRP